MIEKSPVADELPGFFVSDMRGLVYPRIMRMKSCIRLIDDRQ
jgi:hypothetical protein